MVSAPDGVRNNDSGIRLSGAVTGQNADGSVSVQTDKGLVNIALRDRGTLPVGARIEIDIPAGRNPQQVMIRADTSPPPPPARPPSMAETINSTSPTNQLDRNANLDPETMGTVITSGRPDTLTTTTPVGAGPILPDQLIRLTPANLNALAALLPPETLQNLTSASGQAQLVTTLLNLLQNLPASQAALRGNLLDLLGKLEGTQPPSAAAPGSPAPPPGPAAIPSSQLTNNINIIQQTVDNINNLHNSPAASLPPGATSPGTLTPLPNLAKPLDAQIVGFLNIPAVTTPASSPVTSLAAPLSSPGTTIPTASLPTTLTLSPQLTGDAASSTAKPVVLGQFLGVTPQNQPVLSLIPQSGQLTPGISVPPPLFTMSFAPTNIPVGSPMLVTLEPAALPDAILPLPNSFMMQDWDSLTDILTTLNHTAPAQAQSLTQMLPSPAHPQNMGPLSLLFLSLIRSGDVESWMGAQASGLIKQAPRGGDMLKSLLTDLTLAGRSEAVPLGQDWRMMTLPFAFQQHIVKTPVFYKHLPEDDADKDERDRKARRLRFLFDLNLTRMGGVQVDGFMQPDGGAERLDIILRTKSPLSVPMQSQMKKLYAGAMEKSRLIGDLSFQSKPEQWVHLDLSPLAMADHGDTILA